MVRPAQMIAVCLTQMVAHGKLTSSHQITEVNSCVEVLGKILSYHTASVHPAVMGTWWNENWKIVNVISCRK